MGLAGGGEGEEAEGGGGWAGAGKGRLLGFTGAGFEEVVTISGQNVVHFQEALGYGSGLAVSGNLLRLAGCQPTTTGWRGVAKVGRGLYALFPDLTCWLKWSRTASIDLAAFWMASCASAWWESVCAPPPSCSEGRGESARGEGLSSICSSRSLTRSSCLAFACSCVVGNRFCISSPAALKGCIRGTTGLVTNAVLSRGWSLGMVIFG